MDWLGWPDVWVGSMPLLPDAALAYWAGRVSWGLVLAAVLLGLVGRRWPRRLQGGAALLLLLGVALLPGRLSPAYGLSLAFQMPSLSSTLLAVLYLMHVLQPHAVAWWVPLSGRAGGWTALALMGLGWVLLLDTFAVFPVLVYAHGFEPWLLGLLGLFACLPWVLLPQHAGHGRLTVLLLGVLLLYVTLRLPNGNVWNAVLDPWLWFGLHVAGLRWLWRRVSARSRPAGSAAIRA